MSENVPNLEKTPPARTDVVVALKAWHPDSPGLLKEYMENYARRQGDLWDSRYVAEAEQVQIYIDAEMFDEAWVSFDQLFDGIPKEEMEKIKSSPVGDMFDQLEKKIRSKINPDTIPPVQ